LGASVGCKKELKKMLRIGGVIVVIELYKPTFINGKEACNKVEQ
jgi:hypothetical protein